MLKRGSARPEWSGLGNTDAGMRTVYIYKTLKVVLNFRIFHQLKKAVEPVQLEN